MSAGLTEILDEARAVVLAELQAIIPDGTADQRLLKQLILDYPLRQAKGLRPALCLQVCRALGGREDMVRRTAAVLELYHNAFLLHDDVEDGSLLRRGEPALHREHGVPTAINTGDAMLALALGPLLENTARMGLGRALRVLEVVAHMVRESVEGQALELSWIQRQVWDLSEDDYTRMVVQKTAWYSFMAPMQVGAIAAGARPEQLDALLGLARDLGIAFQVQDDLLNLEEGRDAYGKELAGDLWEGKRTIILLHTLRHLDADERARAHALLARPRPEPATEALVAELDRLRAAGELSAAGHGALLARLADGAPTQAAEVAWLQGRIEACGSLAHARAFAARHARAAGDALTACHPWLPPSPARDFLHALVDYVLERTR
ncbi:MAG: polyprenyl synthetase family protein [bacterium]